MALIEKIRPHLWPAAFVLLYVGMMFQRAEDHERYMRLSDHYCKLADLVVQIGKDQQEIRQEVANLRERRG